MLFILCVGLTLCAFRSTQGLVIAKAFAFQIVCERRDVLASACAVARAYPLFSRKTSNSALQTSSTTVNVEFLLVPSPECQEDGHSNGSIEEKMTLSSEDLLCLERVCTGVRLAARISDSPCSEMNVDHFLQV
jgi:probable aminopeptidase NPEPL1